VNLHEAFRGASWKLRPSVGTAQHQYIVLNEENFSDDIKRVYRNAIVPQNAVPNSIRIPLAIYVDHSTQSSRRDNPTGSSLRRATVTRVQEAGDEILKSTIRFL
jgi:hypothetical protein